MNNNVKRIGYLPRKRVLEIIDKISQTESISRSKVVGILVEEALDARGIANFGFINKQITNSGDENSVHRNTNQAKNINITEDDIKTYGQWPWPRHVMAMLHAKLSDAGAILVNYNILFAEPDRMSGVEYLKSMPMTQDTRFQLEQVLIDTDSVFSTVLRESKRAVLMMSVKNIADNNLPSATPIIEKGNVKPWIYEFGGIVSPHPKISAGSSGMGVNVTSPEPDAVVRKMPMLIRINGKIYPSMVLENVRLLNGSKRIKICTF